MKRHENAFSFYRVVTWRRTDKNKQRNQKTHLCSFLSQTVTQWLYIAADCCSQRDTVFVRFSVLLYSILNVQLVYGRYNLHLNCTYNNYTEAAATCSAAQQHSTFTVQILYKLYSLQLNCTYSNYTEAAVTCSIAQQRSTFTVQILYKLYSLPLNCTCGNYTEAAVTCSIAQQHSTFTVQILYKRYILQLNCTYSNYTEAASTCSGVQQERNCPADVFWSILLPVAW